MRKLLILIAFIHLLLISCLRSPDSLAETDCEYLFDSMLASHFPVVNEVYPGWSSPVFIDNEKLIFIQSRKIKGQKETYFWFEIDLLKSKSKKLKETDIGPSDFFDFSPTQGFLFMQRGEIYKMKTDWSDLKKININDPVMLSGWFGENVLCRARPPATTGQLFIYSLSGELKSVISTPEYFSDVWIDEKTLITASYDSLRCWAYPSMFPLWSSDYKGIKNKTKNRSMFADLHRAVAVNPKSIVQGFVNEVFIATPSQIARYNVLSGEMTPIWLSYGCIILDSDVSISEDGKYLAITISELQYWEQKKQGILVLNLETGQETTYFP